MPIVNRVHGVLRMASGGGFDPTGGLARLGLAPGNGPLFDAVVEQAPVGVFLTDTEAAHRQTGRNSPRCASYSLITYPREGLDVELKRWLDTSDERHQADLMKAIRPCQPRRRLRSRRFP